jgi:hypothetical protein
MDSISLDSISFKDEAGITNGQNDRRSSSSRNGKDNNSISNLLLSD